MTGDNTHYGPLQIPTPYFMLKFFHALLTNYMYYHTTQLHWLPISSRIKFKVLVFTFKALLGLALVYLQELLHLYMPSSSLRSSAVRVLTSHLTKLPSMDEISPEDFLNYIDSCKATGLQQKYAQSSLHGCRESAMSLVL